MFTLKGEIRVPKAKLKDISETGLYSASIMDTREINPCVFPLVDLIKYGKRPRIICRCS